MGDFNFMKLIVCGFNGWNPYSDEMKQLPDFYWMIAFRILMYKQYRTWTDLTRPQAELITSIVAPENFESYLKWKRKEEESSKSKSLETQVDGYTIAKANAHLDPELGLVDSDGNVIIPKDEFLKRSNLDGIAIAY